MKALHMVYPDMPEDEMAGGGKMNYPRPISEPPSPSSSRATTPAPSRHGSDDEVDSEAEVRNLSMKFPIHKIAAF